MNDAVVYEIPSDETVALTEGLMRVYEKLGRPDDVSTSQGWVMIDNIMQVWHRFFPHEVEDWKHDLAQDLANEKIAKELAASNLGMYNPITYPPRLYAMIKAFFPHLKLHDRSFIKKMVGRYPILKSTNLRV